MIFRRTILKSIASGLMVSFLPKSGTVYAQNLNVLKQGVFSGESGHATSGSAALTEQNGKQYVSIGADFSFDGAPDPKVALGNDGFRPETISGALKSNSGAQSFAIPAGLDATEYNEIWIWCEKFNVPLGFAKLE